MRSPSNDVLPGTSIIEHTIGAPMIRTFTALCLASMLAGCAPMKPDDKGWYIDRQVMGDSQMILHYHGTLAEVNGIAMRYCAGRGKTAVVQSQTRINEDRMTTSYLCR
jgi:hypothetical protein